MAKNVLSVLSRTSATDKGADLVDQIAALSHGGKMRRCTSFAAKFRHFVIDENLFPIYDEAARQTIRLHLGKQYVNDNTTPYATFCKNFGQLRTAVGFEGLPRVMDRYLWIVGMYMKWKKERLRRAHRSASNFATFSNDHLGSRKLCFANYCPAALTQSKSNNGVASCSRSGPSALDQHRDFAMGKDLYRLAAEDNCGNAVAAMRSHDD
jgi:hypothetical protein